VADGLLYAVSDNGHVYAFMDLPAQHSTVVQDLFSPLLIGAVGLIAIAVAVVVLWIRRSRHGP